jgi:hypothetical protein
MQLLLLLLLLASLLLKLIQKAQLLAEVLNMNSIYWIWAKPRLLQDTVNYTNLLLIIASVTNIIIVIIL